MAVFSILASNIKPRRQERARARKGAEAPFSDIYQKLSVSPFSGKSHYVCSVFRRRLERKRLNRFTHCFRLTRSTEVRRKSAAIITIPQEPLRVSLPPFSPCFAEGQSESERLNRYTYCFRLTRSTED